MLHFDPAQIFLCYSKLATNPASAISFLPRAVSVTLPAGRLGSGSRRTSWLEAAQLTDPWLWGLAFAISSGQVSCLGKEIGEQKQ